MSTMQPDQPDQGGTGLSVEELVRTAIRAIEAAQMQEPNDSDSGVLAQCAKALYGMFASRQKTQDQMMGGNPGVQGALRRGY